VTAKGNFGVFLAAALAIGIPSLAAWSSENYIDTIRGDAPELAAYGNFKIGVRTLHLANRNQPDVRSFDPKTMSAAPRYDRPLDVEVWYPADPGAKGSTVLKALLRDGKTIVDLQGRAIRDAKPVDQSAAFPLVIISHGYPGNRFLMSPIAENIASKGYVVVSIDHTDSTYDTLAAIGSSLVNRSKDQLFVLDSIEGLALDRSSFLYKLVDTKNVGIIGYSMGGYGTLVTIGCGLTPKFVASAPSMFSLPLDSFKQYERGSSAYGAMSDSRIKVAVTFAPAGLKSGWFDVDSLLGIRVPVLFIGGSVDDVVGYEDGIRPTWQGASGVDRALLTFNEANHNAGAPMPPPREAFRYDERLKMDLSNHYIEAVWDNTRMNNISEHFITAWLGKYLKADAGMDSYLNLLPDADRGVWAIGKDGQVKEGHTYWKGFPARTAKGLRFEVLKAGQ